MKKAVKIILYIIGILVLIAALLLAWLSIAEYRPDPVEKETVISDDTEDLSLSPGSTFSVTTWNIGYAGLGAGSDFFMDGGKNVKSADEEQVSAYLKGIQDTLNTDGKANIYLLQEVDQDSHRTYGIDEAEYLGMNNYTTALNYSCPFVPYPWPPIGKVQSGLMSISDYSITDASRIALPCPFKWPLRIANLKRCLLVSYIPIEGTDHYLVAVNLHLEAYDSGEGRAAQSEQLKEFIAAEYAKGNYVIAGGDFNQNFPGTTAIYPDNHSDLWSPGELDNSLLPDGFSYAYDLSSPTCRLLNQPYNPSDTENTQYYVIDGFIVSPNIRIDRVTTLDEDFANSDHNPVHLTATLLDS